MLGRGAGAEPKQHPAPPGPTSATCPLIQRPSRLWRSASRHKQTTTKGQADGRRRKTGTRPRNRRVTEKPTRAAGFRTTVLQQLLSATPGPRARTSAAPPSIPGEEDACTFLYHSHRQSR